jgi:ABC-2 type transport system ATP-binding protein
MKTSLDHKPAIAAEGLVKTYPGDVRALDGLDLAVPAGTIFALLGPNGAGKSTTVRILTTLSRADSGAARVAGHDVVAAAARVRQAIGCVGQRSGADREATGRENLVLQGQLQEMRGRALGARVDDLLAQFGLTDAADRIVKTYSGGMQRRLDIAMALVHRPQVLFLDEPTTGLDPQIRLEIHGLIEEMKAEKRTVVLTTHYIEEAERLCDRVAIIDEGRIVALGTPRELQQKSQGQSRIDIVTAQPLNGAAVPSWPDALETKLTDDGRSLTVYSSRPARTLFEIMRWLDQQGMQLEDVHLKRPTLEDVFVELTGKKLRD